MEVAGLLISKFCVIISLPELAMLGVEKPLQLVLVEIYESMSHALRNFANNYMGESLQDYS